MAETGDSDGGGEDANDEPLPVDVVERAVTLTRRAREAVDDAETDAYRRERDERLAEHGYVARVRTDGSDDVLVCYPSEWMADGTLVLDRVEDVDRGVERPLSGVGGDDWDVVDADNRDFADSIEADHGPVHGATAQALADFASNHYRKRVTALTPDELDEFREEYFTRNAFPSEDQREALDATLEIVREQIGSAAGNPPR